MPVMDKMTATIWKDKDEKDGYEIQAGKQKAY